MNHILSISVQKRKVLMGAMSVSMGILAPMVFNINNFEIHKLLRESITDLDTGKLILAAFKLVILNSIRALPHYLGAFIIAESITAAFMGRTLKFPRMCSSPGQRPSCW
jgi:hypothetical protein